MTTEPRSLDNLPTVIKRHVASFIDRPTAKSLKRTSQGSREMGEMAMARFLKCQKVTSLPPLVKPKYVCSFSFIRFEGPGRKWTWCEEEHLDRLKKCSEAYSEYLSVYPSAASYLRHLTIELRDDVTEANWVHLRRFGPQLEGLHIEMLDHYWQLSTRYVQSIADDNEVDTWSDMFEDCPDPSEVWKRGLGSVSIFDKLAALTIDTASRSLEHLHGILPFTPNLRGLTLICHWYERDDEADILRVPTFAPDALVNLERLSLIGELEVVSESAVAILSAASKVRDVSIHCDRMMGHDVLTMRDRLVERLGKQGLESLTITGAETPAILFAMESRQRRHSVEDGFDTVKRLVFDGSDGEPHHSRDLHLTQHFDMIPPLPALESIALVQTEKAGERHETRAAEMRVMDDPKIVSDIFDKYPRLLQVQFIDGIPSRSFTPHSASTWSYKQIRGWICRTYGLEPSPIKMIKVHTFADDENDELKWYDIGVGNGESLTIEEARYLYDMDPGSGGWVTSERGMEFPSGWEDYSRAKRLNSGAT